MKEAVVYKGMKPTIVYAKALKTADTDWLVFISKVKESPYPTSYPNIYYFYCEDIKGRFWGNLFSENGEPCWGYLDNKRWRFYTPTEEQKKKVIGELTIRGYKYVSVLNKLVKKT